MRQKWVLRAAEVAQAASLAEAWQRCAEALAALLPVQACELVWDVASRPRTIGSTREALSPLPTPAQMRRLRDGQPVPPERGAGFVPVQVANQLAGWLRIESAPWTMEQAQNLVTLATLLGPVVALLDRQEREREVEQRRTLLGAVSRMRVPLDPAALLEQVYHVTRDLVSPSGFFIALRDDESEWFEIAYFAHNGPQPLIQRFWPRNAGLAGVVMETRMLLLTDDYARACVERNFEPLLVLNGAIPSAWLGVPLIARDQVLGTLVVYSTTPGATFSPTQADLLQTLANEAAVSIQNSRIYARVERQASQLSLLNRIGRTITSSLDPERVPLLIIQQVQELLDVEEGSLLLEDDETGDLVFTYVSGPTGQQLVGQRLPRGVGIAGDVVTSGRSAVVNDTSRDMRFYEGTDKDTGFTTRSLMAVPLRGLAGVIGVIEVLNRRNGAPFTKEDQQLLEAVADQAVIALENARRFARVDQDLARRAQELDRSNGQLRELLRIGNALRVEHRLDELLRQITASVSSSTGFHSAVIALVQRERTAQPYLQRVVGSGPVLAAMPRLLPVRAPLSEVPNLLRPEFQRSASTYFISHRAPDYVQFWGGAEKVYIPALPDASGGWHPYDALFTLMRDSRGDLLGLLCVDEPEDGALPTAEQVQVLEIYANQAAVAIENARLYDEQQRSLESMMALNALGMAINTSLRSEEQIFRLTISGMVESTSAQRAVALLVEPTDPAAPSESAAPVLRSAFTREFLTDAEQAIVSDLAQKAVAAGRLVAAEETADTLAWVAIPLRATQEVLGAMCVGYSDGLPTATDLETLTLFASQSAVAVESMRFFSAVRQGRDELASILASTQEGILLLSDEGRVVVANEAIYGLLGLPQPDSAGVASLQHLPLDAFLNRWAAVTAYGGGEWQVLHMALDQVSHGSLPLAQGQLNPMILPARTLEWTALRVSSTAPLLEAASAARGSRFPILLVLRDITAAKEAERLRQDLTSMIVHDLRSPLSSVTASIELIFKGIAGEVTDKQRHILTIALNNVQNLLDLVNTMLDIGRLESGHLPLQRHPLDLHEVVHHAVERLSLSARQKRIMVDVDLPNDLSLVYADDSLILRVVQNLLDNALKFSYDGSHIVVSATNPLKEEVGGNEAVPSAHDNPLYVVHLGRFVTVTVRDRGPGIDTRDLDMIFTKFGQSGDQRHRGTGLGLTFCKLVVENHGGRIWVESSPGEGSSFSFTLPLAEMQAHAP